MKLKTFRQFISETPNPNVEYSKHDSDRAIKKNENTIHKNHQYSTKLEDTDVGSILCTIN